MTIEKEKKRAALNSPTISCPLSRKKQTKKKTATRSTTSTFQARAMANNNNNNNLKTVLVAAAALLDDRGRVLLSKRPEGKSMAGLFEFPGGKVEVDRETLEAALARELHEELGIDADVSSMRPLTFASHTYDAFYLVMPLFAVTSWKGEPTAREGQGELVWAPASDLRKYEMPPADLPLLDAVEAAARARAVPSVADAT